MMHCLNLNDPTISNIISRIGYLTTSDIITYNGIEILDIVKQQPFLDLKEEIKKSYQYQLNTKEFNQSIDDMVEISFWRIFTPSFYDWFGNWMIQYKLQNNLSLSEKEQDVLATKYQGSYDNLKADISKIVTEDGLPKLVYHSSLYDFPIFKNRDYIHFGTLKAAEDRLDVMIGRLPFTNDNQFSSILEEQLSNISSQPNAIAGITIKPYFLNIKKVIVSEDVIAGWTGKVLLDELNSGIEYKNELEDKSSISYAIRDINQTKSAILPSEDMSALLVKNLVEELKVTPEQAKPLIPTKFLNPTDSKIIYFQRLNDSTYGFVTPDGKVFIDKSTQSLNTPFHEFYHIYDKIILSNYSFDERAKSIIDKLNELVVEGGYLDKVKKLDAYKDDNDEQQLAEARAMLIGDAASSKINEAEHGFLMKLKSLLKDLVDYILDLIGTKSFKDFTPEQILTLSMDRFVEVMIRDMMFDKSFDTKKNIELTSEQRKNIQKLKQLEPEYAKGTDEQVQKFIESIYPDSKVKDIVYHGGKKGIAKYDKEYIGKNEQSFTKAFYFNSDANEANNYRFYKGNSITSSFPIQNYKIGNQYYFFPFGTPNELIHDGKIYSLSTAGIKEEYKVKRVISSDQSKALNKRFAGKDFAYYEPSDFNINTTYDDYVDAVKRTYNDTNDIKIKEVLEYIISDEFIALKDKGVTESIKLKDIPLDLQTRIIEENGAIKIDEEYQTTENTTTVYPNIIDVQHPFIVIDDTEYLKNKRLIEQLSEIGYDISDINENQDFYGYLIDSKKYETFTDFLKNKGYDSFIIQRKNDIEYQIFESEQITILNSPETIQKWNKFLNKNNTQFQNNEISDNRKKQVEELFEENPDFSSQIYEALGFTGAISLKSNLKNTGKTEQELIEYLKKKYPEIKLNITNNPIWEQGDDVFNQELEEQINNFELFEDQDKLCPSGICNYTAKASTEHLQKIGLNPYPSNYNGSQLPVKVKSPIGDFDIEHYVSAVVVNNVVYIYDMPQNEFISNEFFGKGSDVKVKESYKPRLIPLTIDEIKANYNLSTKEAGNFIHSIINNKGWMGANAAPSFKEYIQNNIKNSEEYINLLEAQIKDSGYEFKEWDVEEYRKGIKDKRDTLKTKKVTKEEEQKVIKYYENKLKLKTKEYLPKKADKFSLKTLVDSVIGRGFDRSIDLSSFETALESLDKYLKSETFIEDLLDKVTIAKENLDSINKSIDQVYSLAKLFASFTKQVKVYGIEEAIKKYDSKQQYTIRTLLPSNVLDKYKSKEQAALLLQKYWGNKDNIVKQLNIFKTKTFTALITNKFKAHSVFNKYQTILNFLKSTDFDSSYLYQVISNEAVRKYTYFDKIGNTQFQKDEFNRIIGQANIKAMTVLVDAVNKKADTIPHEYAHHYIAWFRNTPIVQEGIKRFGSEEALVQAIGEQVVKQKGEAYNWWKKFTNFILRLLSDKQLLQVLTDSFLNRTDLSSDFTYNQITPQQKQQALQLYSQYLESLNKPNTNPILQTNQEEQVKKFAELQGRLNNKEFLEGAKNAYENSEGLKSFGTQEEYTDYIARVSLGIIKNPSSGDYNYTSQVKDIVYHGTNTEFEVFDKTKLRSSKAFHFSNLKETLLSKIKMLVLLNITNPIDEMPSRYEQDIIDDRKKQGYDGVITDADYREYERKPELGKEYVVFEPEQVHILSSKADIEGFKEFISKNQNVQLQTDNNLISTQQSETYDYVFEKLFENFNPYVTELTTDRKRAQEILNGYDTVQYQDKKIEKDELKIDMAEKINDINRNKEIENQIKQFNNDDANSYWSLSTNEEEIKRILKFKYPLLDFVIINEYLDLDNFDNSQVLKAKIKVEPYKNIFYGQTHANLHLDIFQIEDVESEHIVKSLDSLLNKTDDTMPIYINDRIYYRINDSIFKSGPIRLQYNNFDIISDSEFDRLKEITDIAFEEISSDDFLYLDDMLYYMENDIADDLNQQTRGKIALLKDIKEKSPVEYYSILAKYLINSLPSLYDESFSFGNYSQSNTYNPQNDALSYSIEYRNYIPVLLHELMHNFQTPDTAYTHKEEEFINKITELYKMAVGQVLDNYFDLPFDYYRNYSEVVGKDGKSYYGLVNINEFIAESMTNPEFQRYLSTIKTNNGKSVFEEIYDAVVKLIKSLLNEDISTESNLLIDTIDTIVDFMEKHNIHENVGKELMWDRWKVDIINKDPSMTYDIWQSLTNKEKLQIINCL